MLYTTINNGDLYPLEFRTWTQPDRHPMFSWIESFAGNCAEEIKDECIPSLDTDAFGSFDVMALLKKYLTLPYMPALSRPGWLKKYIMGPHDAALLDSFLSDLWAGVIVAMTLIPQVSINFIFLNCKISLILHYRHCHMRRYNKTILNFQSLNLDDVKNS